MQNDEQNVNNSIVKQSDKVIPALNQFDGAGSMPNQNEGDNLEIFGVEKPKKNIKVAVIAIVLIVLLLVGAFGIFYVLKKNEAPKKVFENAINTVYSGLEDLGKDFENNETIDLKNDPVNIDLTAKLSSNMAELKNFTNLEYGINLGLDVKNEKVLLGANVKENSKSLIEALATIANDEVYLKTSIFDKIIDLGKTAEYNIDLKELMDGIKNSDVDIEYEDIKYVAESIKTMLINSLDEKKFSTTDAEIEIVGKNTKVKKVTYNLDKENMERTVKFLQSEMLKDEKFIDTLVNILSFSKDKEELEKEIRNGLQKEIDFSTYEDSSVSLYINSLKVIVAGEMYVGEFKNLYFTNSVDAFECQIYSQEGEYATLKCVDDSIKLELFETSSSNNPILQIDIKETEIKVSIDYNANGSKCKIAITLTDIKEEDKKFSSNYKLSIDVEDSNSKMDLDLELEGTYKVTIGILNSFDTKNAVKKEELTQEDMNKMIENLTPLLTKFGLDEMLNGNNPVYPEGVQLEPADNPNEDLSI